MHEVDLFQDPEIATGGLAIEIEVAAKLGEVDELAGVERECLEQSRHFVEMRDICDVPDVPGDHRTGVLADPSFAS